MRNTLFRIFQTGWINFRRNSYLSFGTTGVMILTLLLFSALLALNYISGNVVGTLREKVDVSTYFKTDSPEEQILSVKSDLEKLATVRSVEYISRDQALEDFKKRHAGDPLIQESLDQLDENPLQASLNIKAKNPGEFASIVSFLEANKFRSIVDKVNYYENEQVIKRVESISRGLQNWGLISTLFLSVVAILVTFNTIRLTIFNQKNEIEIMRLVGGSNWFIKLPFMVEGAIYGILAALAATVIFYPVLYFVSPKVEGVIPGLSLMSYFISSSFQYLAIVLGAGILLGIISSFVAIRRFLKI